GCAQARSPSCFACNRCSATSCCQDRRETKMTRSLRKALLGGIAVSFAAMAAGQAIAAEDTIKVGILHSLSGTMAISETTLKDVMLMLIDEQNKKGGLLGKKLEAVVVDPASDWPLFAEKAKQLLEV